jgi:hypothetical protein
MGNYKLTDDKMRNYISKASVGDVSDAAGTDQWLITAPSAGVLRVDACFIALTEATGAMTVDGTLSLVVGGNTVGTATYTDSAAIGSTFAFVPDGTNTTAANPSIEFAAGDDILIEVGTQATGVTTGDGDGFLFVDFGL